MSRSPQEEASYWSQLVEDFQTSSKEFYEQVEVCLKARRIPFHQTRRTIWSEGGLLEGEREYLQVEGQHHLIDICAAPYGTGYFFSTRLRPRKASHLWLWWLIFAIGTLALWGLLGRLLAVASPDVSATPFQLMLQVLMRGPVVLIPASLLLILCIVALGAKAGKFEAEAAVLETPGVSWVYRVVFAPQTYYRQDTAVMFVTAVEGAVRSCIAQTTSRKGLRSLEPPRNEQVAKLAASEA